MVGVFGIRDGKRNRVPFFFLLSFYFGVKTGLDSSLRKTLVVLS